jgi:hypothetical protein
MSYLCVLIWRNAKTEGGKGDVCLRSQESVSLKRAMRGGWIQL